MRANWYNSLPETGRATTSRPIYTNTESYAVNIKLELQRVREFVQAGNYHAAYNIALSGMNACRRQNDQPGVDRFIDLIREVVEALANEYGSRS